MYTRENLLQAAYASVDSRKKNKHTREGIKEYWYGRKKSLLAQTLAETQKNVVKPIKNTQQVSPKTL
jgi:hypothetical protein